jgi:hydroxymethylpyrimidine/phosphomethylpyrimidine kinase
MKSVLTIAGSDCSGGAGIQADLKTMMAHGVYGMSAIAALTAQNTTGVSQIMEVTPEFLDEELEMIFTDIYPDAVKIGMISSCSLISTVRKKLEKFQAKHIVLDPVMVATSGAKLLQDDAIEALRKELLSLAEVITPNIPETEVLVGYEIRNLYQMQTAACELGRRYDCSVLVKGGHSVVDATDVLFDAATGHTYTFAGRRIENPNTHGTGCTLSSAIACNLALGYRLPQAVELAKEYISGALESGLDLGRGSGPLDHGYRINETYRGKTA